MKELSEQDIQQLLTEVKSMVTMEDIFVKCSPRLDMESLSKAIESGEVKNVSTTIAYNYAYIGFLEGVEFALRNLETNDDD